MARRCEGELLTGFPTALIAGDSASGCTGGPEAGGTPGRPGPRLAQGPSEDVAHPSSDVGVRSGGMPDLTPLSAQPGQVLFPTGLCVHSLKVHPFGHAFQQPP